MWCSLKKILFCCCGVFAAAGGAARSEEARTEEGYRVAEPGYAYAFPRDHGSHPGFRIEWWYLTGHLEAEAGGDRFGFQATFFRNAAAAGRRDGEGALFGSDQVYLAHMALLHVDTGAYVYEERLNREGWDAGAKIGYLDVHNGNWRLRRAPDAASEESMVLEGSVLGDARFRLRLSPEKEKVIFGEDGISRKAAGPADASYYITFPRLAAEGEMNWRGREMKVAGRVWMDHEISSSQLGEGQVGWDWASIHLDDGRDMMVYRMRTADGKMDAFSRMTWIGPDGEMTRYGPDAFRWEGVREWKSPATGAVYPIEVIVKGPNPETGREIALRLRPLADAQELEGALGGVAYWEGACEVLDEAGAVVGKAFVELTGYDGKLAQRLRK